MLGPRPGGSSRRRRARPSAVWTNRARSSWHVSAPGALLPTPNKQAGRMRAEANAYVAGQLNSLENRLQRVLHEVQAGQRYLSQPTADKAAPENKSQP